MGKYYAAAEALFSIIGLYGTACPVSELSSALIQLRCSFRPDMLFPERDARRYRRRHWRRQSFRITSLAGTWRNDQYLFIHRNALLAFCFFYSMITHKPGLRSRLFQNQKHAELFNRVSAEKVLKSCDFRTSVARCTKKDILLFCVIEGYFSFINRESRGWLLGYFIFARNLP